MQQALWRLHVPDDAEHDADHAGNERALLQAAHAFRRLIVLRDHSLGPPGFSSPAGCGFSAGEGGCITFSRTSAGSSAILALRLSCSARTYATMAQRSRGLIWAEYSYMAPNPLV